MGFLLGYPCHTKLNGYQR
ncbi:outer membrane autotransporter barrel domain protein, partial [Chlamydia psittaci 02DC15]